MIRLASAFNYGYTHDGVHVLNSIGINVGYNNFDDKMYVANFPLDIIICSPDDFSHLFAAGLIDLAIVDSFRVDDSMQIIRRLGQNKQKLVLLSSLSVKNKNLSALNGKAIATSNPKLLGDYLKKNDIRAKIVETQSPIKSLETSGLFDYACDFVDADITTFKNVQLVDTIAESEAVLVACKQISPQNQLIVDELLARIDAMLQAENKHELTMCVPTENCAEVHKLLGESVTCIATDAQTSYVRAVVEEVQFWDALDKLKTLQATNIILNKIEKLVP